MLDEKGKLYENANLTASGGAALDVQSTAVNVGRGGLHRNTGLTVFVQKADANRTLEVTFQYTLDNGTNWREGNSITIPPNFKGQFSVPVGIPEFVWDRYTGSDIDVRVDIDSPSHAQAGDWDNVAVWLGLHIGTVAGYRDNAGTPDYVE